MPYIRRYSREGGKYGSGLRGGSYILGVIPAKAGIQSFCNTMKRPCVYLLASGRNGTLYVGVTSGLTNRLSLHREDVIGGFTQKYGVHRLVWFEEFEDMPTAITREKQIKKWNRAWKLRLIESHNPQWRDLWEEIV